MFLVSLDCNHLYRIFRSIWWKKRRNTKPIERLDDEFCHRWASLNGSSFRKTWADGLTESSKNASTNSGTDKPQFQSVLFLLIGLVNGLKVPKMSNEDSFGKLSTPGVRKGVLRFWDQGFLKLLCTFNGKAKKRLPNVLWSSPDLRHPRDWART